MSTPLVAEGQHHYLALGALALVALAYVYSALSGPLSKIPGPWYSSFTDSVLRYHWLTGRRAKYVHSLHEKYGSHRAWSFFPDPIPLMHLQVLLYVLGPARST